MEFYITRHGETDWNRNDRLQGQADIPLNKKGKKQALKAKEKIKDIAFDEIISSPLDRAITTGELMTGLSRDAFTIDERLLELSYGPMEGVSFYDLDEDVLAFFKDPIHVKASHGIEPMDHLIDRTGAFIEEKLNGLEKRYLILTHGVAMRAMLKTLLHLTDEQIWSLDIDNCAIYHIQVSDHTIKEVTIL